jgi:hypothetical protein
MTIVRIDVRELSGIDPGVEPVDRGSVDIAPYRPYHVEDGSEDYLVGALIRRIKLVDGLAAPVLPPTPAGEAVKVQIRGVRGAGTPVLVVIPDVSEVSLFDLPHVDESTLDPGVEPTPYWLTYMHEQVADAIDGILDGAPAAMDTLGELADALGGDPNFATTVLTSLAGKVDTATYTAALAALNTAIGGKQSTATFAADKRALDATDAANPTSSLRVGMAPVIAAAAASAASSKAPLDSAALTGVVTLNGVPLANSDNLPNLLANGNPNFELAVPLAAAASTTNWGNVNGTTRLVASVADGPAGTTTNVLRITDSGLSGVKIAGLIAGGWAGRTLRVKAKVRGLVNGATTFVQARILVADSTTPANLNLNTLLPNLPFTWTEIHVDVPIPSVTDGITISLGVSTTPGSSRIEYDTIDVRVAGTSLLEAVGAAVPPAVTTALATAGVPTRTEVEAGYVSKTHDAPTLRSNMLAFAKGPIGTAGKTPLAIRFDDWQDDILTLGIMGEMRSRGLCASVALCSMLGSNPWNDAVTYDDIRSWNRDYGIEIWSHGTDHQPINPAIVAEITEQVVLSKTQIEAQNLRVMGWARPGLAGTEGFGNDLNTDEGWLTSEVGRQLMNTYALVETDRTWAFRQVPSPLRYGLGHATVSDGQTLVQNKDTVDAAIARDHGLELMCHVGNLGATGHMTVAEFLQLLDYIVVKRDAGLVEVITPSSLAFADPSHTRRRRLLANGDFATAAPMTGSSTSNWNGMDGTTRQIVTIADGPTGTTAPAYEANGSSMIGQQFLHTIDTGLSGMVLKFEGWARAKTGTTTARVELSGTGFDMDRTTALTTTWKRIVEYFTIPPDADTANFNLGRSASGTIQWVGVSLKPA